MLEGGGPRVSTENGEVTLDLRAIIDEAADRIGIGRAGRGQDPRRRRRIVILRSDELDTAQNGFQLLKTLAWVLPLLTLVAFGLAVWLSGDRRRAVRGMGWVLVVVGLVGLLAANLTRNYVVDSLVAREDDRQAANNAWNILTELMRGSFRLMVVVGLLFVVAAWLAGPGRRAVTARGWLAPALQNRVWAYVVLADRRLLLLLFNAEVLDFTRLLVVILLAALGAAWIELTRRQTLAEFPDAELLVRRRHRARMTGWWESRRAPSEPRGRAPAPRRRLGPARLARRAALGGRAHRRGVRVGEGAGPRRE